MGVQGVNGDLKVGKKQHVGYKAQVVETVAEDGRAREKGEPTAQFVLEVATTEATSSAQAEMEQAMQAVGEAWTRRRSCTPTRPM